MRRRKVIRGENRPIYSKNFVLAMFAAFLISLPAASFAQMDINRPIYESGNDYIITRLNDTLPGTVSYGKKIFGGMLNKIHFKNGETGAVEKFRANELLGFAKNGQSYTTKRFEGFSYFFREAITGGYVNLYYLEYAYSKGETPKMASIQKLRGADKKMIYPYLEKNGELHRVFRGSFQKQAEKFFRDNEATINKVNAKEWTFDDIETIVEDYNKDNS